MINIAGLLKAPRSIQQVTGAVRFIRFFKYEFIKALIFLFIFFASVIYVNSQSREYYSTSVTLSK